ncbi:peptidoglycan-binding protein [Streptacidiphilus fuscans]|uniref:Peptidoglycan-binding protein n=1 Tax=Streptacidiphilus fuscans TaxID=2789292 RepID=A0A931B3V9_9ACTN|nr:peptidoglycan-binding protein [Streptacidiphilus fuscans]MBF9069823.1 peptidoglycan-binding protein [Streptacidiphilus fuscans]
MRRSAPTVAAPTAAVATAVTLLAAAGLMLSPSASATSAADANGPWITYDGSHLTYGQDSQGNRIPDYSYAGYEGGGVPIPSVPTKFTVAPPSGGDDTATIQNAINAASALPLDSSGFRGAVQLAAGQYHLAGTLSIDASGVVLRGADSNSADTELVATGATARTLIQIGSTSSAYSVVGTAENVTDNYVPVGGHVVTLASTAGFSVGDQVVVERPTTQAWIDAVGMTNIWSPNWSLRSERTITAINGNRITLDAPLTTALEKQYEQATVYHYTFPRIDHVGLENLSADGQAMTADPNYATDFYNSSLSEVNAVQDSWISNVYTHHFGQNGVTGLNSQSRRVSVLNTGSLDMVVNTATSARSDGYTLQGQENLIDGCEVTATKVHAFETEARQSGPNVYSHCTATTTDVTYDSGGHQRWGSGTLYDDLTIQGSLDMTNYGTEGSGHGWGDANSTAWNCDTSNYFIQEPPTAHNWAIGCTGTLTSGSDGQIQNSGANVLPQSLYDEQLAERLAGS